MFEGNRGHRLDILRGRGSSLFQEVNVCIDWELVRNINVQNHRKERGFGIKAIWFLHGENNLKFSQTC